ncbi:MAG: aspartate aminotransferase family protein [Trueperaceae bacterium]
MTTRVGASHLLYPQLDETLPEITRGEGCYLYDRDGRAWLDGSSGAVVANLGHGVEDVVSAATHQAGQLAFVFRSQFTSRAAEELADLLAELAPGDLNRLFLVNSGSEATELAQKIAIQYWQERGEPQRLRVLSRTTSYHGVTLGALAMSGHAGRRKRFDPLLTDHARVATPYCFRCPLELTFPDCRVACADTLRDELERVGPETVAAFIAEPVVGASGGAIVPPPGYDGRVRDLCDEHGILYIADEVMTGMGRTGLMFASEREDAVPDMLVLGKGLGAGYTPVGAVLVSDRIVDTIRSGTGQLLFGHTMSGNPLTAATALAVVRHLLEHDLPGNAARQGEKLGRRLRELAVRHPVIGDVRGSGLLWGLELVAPSGAPFPAEVAATGRLVRAAFDAGLVIYPAAGAIGGLGDAVLIAPPLNVTDDVLDHLMVLLEASFSQLERELSARNA